MSTKGHRFTPENIQQFKETSKYVHTKSEQSSGTDIDGDSGAVEQNLNELSHRIENIRKTRDVFVDRLNADLDVIENLIHANFDAITGSTGRQNEK